ncbi:MAG TPA: YhdP family protein [Thermomonas sp.]|nr:YhdP family protein [Thermomonas sp.]
MITPARRRWRLLRRGAWHALVAALVLLALGNGIGSQLLPLVERHPDKIAAWLGARAKGEVAFDHVETQWTRRGPLLRLDNLRIGSGADPLRVGDAEILVAQYAGLLPGRSFTELRVRGLDLVVQRDPAGLWSVRGLPGQQQAGGDPFETLGRLGELQVSHARLQVSAPELDLDLRVPRIDLRMRVDGNRILVGAHAWLRDGATPIATALDYDRRSGDGRVYAGTRQADLREFAGSFDLAGVAPASGKGRLRAWGELKAHQIVGIRVDAALQDVVVRGAAVAVGQPPPTQALGTLALDARWTGTIRQWRARAARLRLGAGEAEQVMDGLVVDGGQRYGLQASRIDAAPLLQSLALGEVLPAGMRGWLLASSAGAVLEDVDVRGVRAGALSASARIRGLHFAPVGNAPGMRGVDGWLQGDADGVRLRFDPQATASFDWPAGFGVVHDFNFDGEAVAWRDGNGWSVRTPGLALVNPDLQVRVRGGMGFPGDGTRPRIDLAADLGDAQVSLAHGFWVHHLMPKSTVQWLDAALRGGSLHDIHAVVTGDLDDWPFRTEAGRHGAGVFRVDARMRGGVLKFQPDWPAAENVEADIRFEADGFTVAGRSRIGGVPVSSFKAGIERFGRAELTVDAAAAGDAGQFLGMLRASPLQKAYGATMDNLRVAGPAQAQFHMLLPFHHDRPPPHALHGDVVLSGATLREERWKLAFDQVRGKASYDSGGFAAEGLQVRHEGRPGVLALRAGPHVRDPAHAFEAELDAQIDIDGLLDKAGNLAWLKPHVAGSSTWTLALGIPRDAVQDGLAGRLQLRSNLAGTAIEMPEPLRKPREQALAASVDLRLPLERGEVEVTLGNLLSLRSRSSASGTGVAVRLGGDRAEAPPADGLAVGGRAARVDALDWIGVVAGDRGGESLPLRRIDVNAAQLRLLGSQFADARVLVVPAPRGTAVLVQAATLAGSLLVPQEEGATVAGRFDRLHWTMPPRTGGTFAGLGAVAKPVAPAATDATGEVAAFDPARLPPLLFDVGDLRIGQAVLGQARFRSTPMAGGMRMDEFSTRGGKQRLTANGTWIGLGANARTGLKLEVDSEDIGALLAGLSLGGQVGGGKGKLAIGADWRGGPDALDPLTMQASLRLDARDGRLLEIEPGAGRVLGLLGIGQLPRRLTLDFSDFFDKGFAFDRIGGDVRLANGSARTDNLAIEGPAADIHVRGSADLRSQRFDQTVDVLPKSGGLLTAVGAIAGGPVGAAVGAVANAVLDKPMQELGAKTYRVTGPWNAPKVEVSARSTPSPRPAATPDQPD